MRGLPAASANTSMMHLGNFMDIGGPYFVSIGAHVFPRLGSLDQFRNLGSNIWGLNGSGHFHGGISYSPDAALAWMMLAQSQQRSLLREVLVQSNGLAMIDSMGRQ